MSLLPPKYIVDKKENNVRWYDLSRVEMMLTFSNFAACGQDLIHVTGDKLLPGDLIFACGIAGDCMQPLWKNRHYLVLQSRQENNNTLCCLSPVGKVTAAHMPLTSMYLVFRSK